MGKLGIGLLLLVQGLITPVYAQELVFTAPPREMPKAGQRLYGPIALHLSELLGKRVVYQHAGDWLTYQRDMRVDKFDIVFDGPHFAAWRITHLEHDVLVKLPGQLIFYLLVDWDDQSINQPRDLVGKKICGIAPPNLSTLAILQAYPNPVRQPEIRGIVGGMPAVFAAFRNSRCRAVVVRSSFYDEVLTKKQRQQLKIIHTTKAFPNQSITVSKRVSQRDKTLIVQSLMLGEGVRASQQVVRRFGGQAKSFIPARLAEYKGHQTLLEGVIFGW